MGPETGRRSRLLRSAEGTANPHSASGLMRPLGLGKGFGKVTLPKKPKAIT